MIAIVGNDTPLAWAFATILGGKARLVPADHGFMKAIEAARPELIINCATISYERLKGYEQNLLEFRNVVVAEKLGWYCRQNQCVYIGFSGENIFGGEDGPYNSLSEISATSMMGRYQMAGEQRILKHNPKHLIFRHSWLLSPVFDNLLFELLAPRTLLNARGRPTYVMHLALAIVVWWLDRGRGGIWKRGTYMLSNSGPVTTLAEVSKLALKTACKPTQFNTYETKRDFTFRCAPAEVDLGIRLPRWEVATQFAVMRHLQVKSGKPFIQNPNIWAN